MHRNQLERVCFVANPSSSKFVEENPHLVGSPMNIGDILVQLLQYSWNEILLQEAQKRLDRHEWALQIMQTVAVNRSISAVFSRSSLSARLRSVMSSLTAKKRSIRPDRFLIGDIDALSSRVRHFFFIMNSPRHSRPEVIVARDLYSHRVSCRRIQKPGISPDHFLGRIPGDRAEFGIYIFDISGPIGDNNEHRALFNRLGELDDLVFEPLGLAYVAQNDVEGVLSVSS